MPRILFLSPSPGWRRTPCRAVGTFFLRVVGKLASVMGPSNAPSSSRVDAVERKPRARWSPPGPVSRPTTRSPLFSVLSDIGSPSSLDVLQIAEHGRAISAFGLGLAPSATESIPEVAQHEVSVWLGIVGHNGRGTHDKTLLWPREIVRSIPTGSRVSAGFDSSRSIVRPERHGPCLLPRSRPFYFCELVPSVILLVFSALRTAGPTFVLVVSEATSGDKSRDFEGLSRW
jgi:hypothetical protein